MRRPELVNDLLPDGDSVLIQNALNDLDHVARESVGNAVEKKERAAGQYPSPGVSNSILAVLANSLHETSLFSLGETGSHDMLFLRSMNFPIMIESAAYRYSHEE